MYSESSFFFSISFFFFFPLFLKNYSTPILVERDSSHAVFKRIDPGSYNQRRITSAAGESHYPTE